MLLRLVVVVSGYFVIVRGCSLPEPIMFSFVDASAKIPSGITSGNLADLGSFDDCLALNKIYNGDSYKGKYCLLKVSVSSETLYTRNGTRRCISESKQNRTEGESSGCRTTRNDIADDTGDVNQLNLILGWCIPHSCSIENSEEFISNVIASMLLSQKENITISPYHSGHCQTKEQLETEFSTWSPADVFTIAFLSIIGCIMVLSTTYDVCIYFCKKKPKHVLLTAFSLKTNVQKLLVVSPSKPDSLLCLTGMRYLRMVWILYENRYSLDRNEQFINFSDLRNFQAENMYIMGADQSADTLFFINGLCVAYEFLNVKAVGKHFSVIEFWLRKYVKLAPFMAVMVLTYATILNRFGSGPLWPLITAPLKRNCEQNWWATLFYVQNYYGINNICIGQSWFFAVDNQMFFLSPLFLIPLWKWPKNTIFVAVGLFIGSILSPLLTSFYHELPSPANPNYVPRYFFPTHVRFGAWFMGLVFGYILHTFKDSKQKLHTAIVVFGWILAFTLFFLTTLLPNYLMFEHNRIINALFNGTHRQAWVFGLAWLVYACARGHGGIINRILSCGVFQSLGRLSYIMYVTHVSQQYLVTAVSRNTIYYSDFDTFYKFCGDVFLTTTISAVLYFAFEAPMAVVDNLIFERKLSTAKPPISVLPIQQNEGHTNGGLAPD